MVQPWRPPPTGTQHELTHGDQVAVVTEMGATLRAYEVGGRPVIAGFPATHRPDGGRGQVLAPWPNRIRDGRYSFGGEEHQLGLTEVPKRNAIHGLVRWTGWQLAERGATDVSLTTTVWPQTGYPFLLRLRATYRLGDDGLDVALHARNDGDRPRRTASATIPTSRWGRPWTTRFSPCPRDSGSWRTTAASRWTPRRSPAPRTTSEPLARSATS